MKKKINNMIDNLNTSKYKVVAETTMLHVISGIKEYKY